MVYTIRETKPKARKDYNCDGRWSIDNSGHREESEEVNKQYYRCQGIKKGDKYLNQFNKDGSEVWQYRSCLECDIVVKKYKIYEED